MFLAITLAKISIFDKGVLKSKNYFWMFIQSGFMATYSRYCPIFQNKLVKQLGRINEKFRPIIVGLSIGNLSDFSIVGLSPNSYAIHGCYDCWLSKNLHNFEWPNGAIRPTWNGPGDVFGCGLLMSPEKKLSIFFTGNGILMGQFICL
jgi:hypothetical protein